MPKQFFYQDSATGKDILHDCIDRSLLLLPEMLQSNKKMDANKVTAIVAAIEKLLVIRKQFVQDWLYPVEIASSTNFSECSGKIKQAAKEYWSNKFEAMDKELEQEEMP